MQYLHCTSTIGTHVRTVLGIIALTLTFTPHNSASAKSYQMITAGLGSAMGVNHVSGVLTDGKSAFNLDLNLRVKAAYVLGFEFGYSPTDQRFAHEGLVYGGQLKLSGLVYVVPTRHVSAYVKGGIEGNGFGDLFDYEGKTASYHIGGGIDIELDENWVLGIEYLMLIPGVSSVEQAVTDFVNDELIRIQSSQDVGSTPTIPTTDDFISGDNFRLAVSARYYF